MKLMHADFLSFSLIWSTIKLMHAGFLSFFLSFFLFNLVDDDTDSRRFGFFFFKSECMSFKYNSKSPVRLSFLPLASGGTGNFVPQAYFFLPRAYGPRAEKIAFGPNFPVPPSAKGRNVTIIMFRNNFLSLSARYQPRL